MSGHGFHVHGPHDHEVEHAAQHGDSFSSRMAVITAIFATLGALFSYMGGNTQADAAMFKNNAAIKKTEASNQWNYYQAKSTKQNLTELAMEIPGTSRERHKAEIERYKAEKAEIMAEARKLEAESKSWDLKSEASMHEHHRWAQATTAIQVAIALAAITLLTRKKWLNFASYGVAGFGVLLGILATLHI